MLSLLNSVPGVRTLDLGSHLAGLGGGGQALGPTCKGKKDRKRSVFFGCLLLGVHVFICSCYIRTDNIYTVFSWHSIVRGYKK